MRKKVHEHYWIYDGMSCCYRLRCCLPGCEVRTTARFVWGNPPKVGDPVQFTEEVDGVTIEVIHPSIEKSDGCLHDWIFIEHDSVGFFKGRPGWQCMDCNKRIRV